MVLIHYKKTEHNQFLYETTASAPVSEVIKDLVEINNYRVILDQLAVSIEDLATKGVMKPEELRGLSGEDTVKYAIENLKPEMRAKWGVARPELQAGERYKEDEHHYRFGVIKSKEVCDQMIQNAQNAKAAISKNLVQQKQVLTVKALQEHFDILRGTVMIAYPAYHGLPDWEPTKIILENQHDWIGKETDIAEYLVEAETSLWWAGKELQRSKLLKDYIGKNEKTKIVAKLNKTGQGMPAREPMVDEETQKKMMQFYYKKQEESKQLEEDNDDHFLDAPWANPNVLKNQLHGQSTGGISWKSGKKMM